MCCWFVQGHHTGTMQLCDTPTLCLGDTGKNENSGLITWYFNFRHSFCGLKKWWDFIWYMQMGSTMRPTIFNERVATALRSWHQAARKHTKHGRHSNGVSPQSSRPATPSYGMSPVHLLQGYHNHTPDMSPRRSNLDNEWYGEGAGSPGKKDDDEHEKEKFESREQEQGIGDSSSTQLPLGPRPIRTQHEINITLSDFSFAKRWRTWLIRTKLGILIWFFVFPFCGLYFACIFVTLVISIYFSLIQHLSQRISIKNKDLFKNLETLRW